MKMKTIWELREEVNNSVFSHKERCIEFVERLPADWTPEQIIAALKMVYHNNDDESNSRR